MNDRIPHLHTHLNKRRSNAERPRSGCAFPCSPCRWWDYMADIMETNPDNSPVSIDLKPVFHLD